ncbi:MAG: glycerol-3-phosphate dehydrogenase [Gammaproteobacteria bacterium]|nr:glycerol-3-phosphate dehydrogenase [Gammaproteobacteria bacterium]MBT8094436.1 glycerol-3-phosphate dehydrogenase [Gammaproteobacteria bacterium]NNF50433.1 glycerol-3-phosphate dehydrogenase [Woeseiaceae bacterium]
MNDQARFDLAIIGAGVNGAGIARDAALRGLKVVIFDKNDMCTGCSAISSRLVHGGLRYLEYAEISLVYESLHERRSLLRIARHLVRPLRICIPIYEGARRGPLLIRLGMLAYDILSFRKAMPRHDVLSADAMREAEPGLESDGLRAGARYYDAQVAFAERLVLENLLAARAAGGDVRLHSEVTRIDIADGAVTGLTFEDNEGREQSIEARVVVNAAGPWVDRVLGMTSTPTQRLIGGTKGSHIIVGDFDGAPRDAFYVEAAADGRPFFIIPWYGQYLIGTTDIRYDEDLDAIRASEAEVDYLLAETNRVFPAAGLSRDDIHYAYAGVRPLPYKTKGPESAITRRHIIRLNDDVATGLVSIIGGKLTTYRHLAEQTVDKVGKLLQRRLPACRTDDTDLPGAWGMEAAREKLEALGLLSTSGIDRLLEVYGGRAAAIAEICDNEPEFARALDDARTVLAAEVAFAIREEFAGTLEDIVFRRMMIGLGADQGRALYDAIAVLAAAEYGWDPERLEEQRDALRQFAASWRVE